MSVVENLHHIVFRTKRSQPTLPEGSKRIMLAYLHQVSQDMGATVLRLNCYLNHVHVIVNLPGDLSVSAYTQKIKTTSSKAFHHHSQFPQFEGWARRYASFSKSKEDKDKIVNYIKNQEEHHCRRSFHEELEDLLGKDFFNDIYNRRDWLDESTEQ